jgi:hypothetical protein
MGWATEGYQFESQYGQEFSSFPSRPDRLWGLPNLLSNAYRELSPRESRGRGTKLTTHHQLEQMSMKQEFMHSFPRTSSWRSA